MKAFCITLLTFAIIILSVIGINAESQPVREEYLRVHIRANSNDTADQRVKYQIKEKLVIYLTPVLAECKTKKVAEVELKKRLTEIENLCNEILITNGFTYESQALIREEKFPTRTYSTLTLESGYYDALIINLGEGVGDNWWCVVYPPLCFVEGGTNYVYKSKILEIINDFIKEKEKK